MVALAGTLAISAMMPVVPASLASTDTAPVRPTEVTVDQFDIDPAGGLVGLTAIVDAEGEGVNLRATADHDGDVLTTVPDGTVAELRVDMVDTVYDADGITRWWPVSVGGQDGWIAGIYLDDPDAAPATTALSDGTDGSVTTSSSASRTAYDYTGSMVAEISADGEGLVLRAEPDRDSEKVASLPDGTLVDLRIDMLDTVYDDQGTRWWPVAVDGVEGWVSGFYLIEPGTTPQSATSADAEAAVFSAGDTARVNTPSQRGLVVRVDPSPDSERLTSLHEGQEVQIVEGPASYEGSTNGWYLVSTGSVTGYVDGDLLELVTPAATETPTTPASTDGAFAVGSWAEIRTDDGEGVNLRAGASANSDQSGFAPNQGLVEILAGPENGWYEVRWDRQTGYIDGSLLIPAEAPTFVEGTSTAEADLTAPQATEPAATEAAADAESAAFENGDYAKVDAGSGVGVNIRSQPSQDADRAGFLAEDAVVKITAGPESDDDDNTWYRITDGGQSGWVRGDLITPTEAPVNAEEAATDGEETVNAPQEQDETSGFALPLADFTFTQDYGCSSLGFYTYNPSFGCSVHDGVDLAAPSGTPIHAVSDGTVVASGWCDCGLGYYVEIDHGDGVHSVYGHMASQPYVAVGQTVGQGDVIGPVGSTGLSTGPHTHFMIRLDGVTQDPKNYLPPLS
jgi:murein DD-endopeptidase MepM/ murein hydrolase activator NlpD